MKKQKRSRSNDMGNLRIMSRAKGAWARRLCAAAMSGALLIGTLGSAFAADTAENGTSAETREVTVHTPIENITGPEQWTVEEGVSHIPPDADVQQSGDTTLNPDGTTTNETTTTTTWESSATIEPSSSTTVAGSVPDRPQGMGGTEGGQETGSDRVDSDTMNDYLNQLGQGNTHKTEITESVSGTVTESGNHTQTNATATGPDGSVAGSSSSASGSLQVTEDKVHQTDREETTVVIDKDETTLTGESATFDEIKDEERVPVRGDDAAAGVEWTRDPSLESELASFEKDTTKSIEGADASGLTVVTGSAYKGTVTYSGSATNEEKLDVLKDMYNVVQSQDSGKVLEVYVGDETYIFNGIELKKASGEPAGIASINWGDENGTWSFKTNSDSVHAYKPRQEPQEDLAQTRDVLNKLQPGTIVTIGSTTYTVSASQNANGTAQGIVLTDGDGNVLVDPADDEDLKALWTNDGDGNKTFSLKAEYTNPTVNVTNISLTMSREPNDSDTKAVLTSLDGKKVQVNGENLTIESVSGKTVTAVNDKGNKVTLSADWTRPVDEDGATDQTKWQLSWSAGDGTQALVRVDGAAADWAFADENWKRIDPEEGSDVPKGTITYRHELTGETVTVRVEDAQAAPITWDPEGWERLWEHAVLKDGEEYVDVYTISGTTSYITKAEWEEIYEQLLQLQREIAVLETTLTVSPDGFTRLDGGSLAVTEGNGSGIAITTIADVQQKLDKILASAKTEAASKKPWHHVFGATDYSSSSAAGSQVGSSSDTFGTNMSTNGVVIQSALIIKEEGEEDKDASGIYRNPQAWLREVLNGEQQKMWVYCVGHTVGVSKKESYDLINVKDLVLMDSKGNVLTDSDGEHITAGSQKADGDASTYADHLEYIATNGYWGDISAIKSLLPKGTSTAVLAALDDGIALAVTQAALWRFTNGLHADIAPGDITFNDIFGKAWTSTQEDETTDKVPTAALTGDEQAAALALYKTLVTGTLESEDKPADIITKDDVLSVAISVKEKLDQEELDTLVAQLNKDAAVAANENLTESDVEQAMDAAAAVADAAGLITGDSAYRTDLSITIAVVPSQLSSDNMTVLVYQGNVLVARYTLDPEDTVGSDSTRDEEGNLTGGTAACRDNEDGTSTWTLGNVVLLNGIPVELKLEGTQKLDGGAYVVRTDISGGKYASQPFVGIVGKGSTNTVAIGMTVDFNIGHETSSTHASTSSWTEGETALQTDKYQQSHSQSFTVDQTYQHEVQVTTTVKHSTEIAPVRDVFLAVWADEQQDTDSRPQPSTEPSDSPEQLDSPQESPSHEQDDFVWENPEPIEGPQQNTMAGKPEWPEETESLTLRAEEPAAVSPAHPEGQQQETLAEEPEWPEVSEERTLTAEQESAQETMPSAGRPADALLQSKTAGKMSSTARSGRAVPKTGDDTVMSFWAFIAFAAVITVIGAFSALRRKKTDGENV